jgi:AGZA family xanthine/uracil permease-like MFS transporter
MLLFTPLAMAIPRQATAPALILIGVSMLGTLRHAAGHAAEDLLPTILMVLITLISNSFGTGIAAGIVSYVLVRLLSGRWRDLSPGLVLLAIPLTYYFIVAATARH